MKFFLSICCSLLLVGAATVLWRYETNKLINREARILSDLRSDIQALQVDMHSIETSNAASRVTLGRDISSLKTDYAEFTNLRDSLDHYLGAKEKFGAFRELGEACGNGFLGLLAKEQGLDARLKKLETKHDKK